MSFSCILIKWVGIHCSLLYVSWVQGAQKIRIWQDKPTSEMSDNKKKGRNSPKDSGSNTNDNIGWSDNLNYPKCASSRNIVKLFNF